MCHHPPLRNVRILPYSLAIHTLSLRLRSNIWGDDFLLAILNQIGIMGLPLIFFSTFLALIAAVVQAAVFCLLTTVYFALIMHHEGDEKKEVAHGL